MNHSPESFLESRWQELNRRPDPEILWIGFRSTPALPSLWPPTQGLQLLSYVYAYGNYSDIRRSIVDGEFISAPWACVRKDVGRDTSVMEWLEDGLHQIGIQGFRPLNEDELALFEQAPQIEDVFEHLLKNPTEVTSAQQRLRGLYRMWLDLNGVIGSHIRKSHTAFFEWLESG